MLFFSRIRPRPTAITSAASSKTPPPVATLNDEIQEHFRTDPASMNKKGSVRETSSGVGVIKCVTRVVKAILLIPLAPFQMLPIGQQKAVIPSAPPNAPPMTGAFVGGASSSDNAPLWQGRSEVLERPKPSSTAKGLVWKDKVDVEKAQKEREREKARRQKEALAKAKKKRADADRLKKQLARARAREQQKREQMAKQKQQQREKEKAKAIKERERAAKAKAKQLLEAKKRQSSQQPPPKPPAPKPSPPPPSPQRSTQGWAPSREEEAARRLLILSLVRSDAKQLLDDVMDAMPWASKANKKLSKAKQKALGELERRRPILQWHVNNNVLPAEAKGLITVGLPPVDVAASFVENKLGKLTPPDKVIPSPSYGESKNATRSRAARTEESDSASAAEQAQKEWQPDDLFNGKNIFLKDALLEVSPTFFALVGEAVKVDPSRKIGMYRRVGSALATLGWWNTGRMWRAGPKRQYPLMNDFLQQIVDIVTECESILGCDGDRGCVVDAVESEKTRLEKEVRRAAVRPSMTRSRLPYRSGISKRKNYLKK